MVGQQPPSGCQPQAAMPGSLSGCRPAAASAAPDLGQRGRRPDAHPACVTIMPVMLGQPLERSPSPESRRPGPQNGPRRQAESALANKGLHRKARMPMRNSTLNRRDSVEAPGRVGARHAEAETNGVCVCAYAHVRVFGACVYTSDRVLVPCHYAAGKEGGLTSPLCLLGAETARPCALRLREPAGRRDESGKRMRPTANVHRSLLGRCEDSVAREGSPR